MNVEEAHQAQHEHISSISDVCMGRKSIPMTYFNIPGIPDPAAHWLCGFRQISFLGSRMGIIVLKFVKTNSNEHQCLKQGSSCHNHISNSPY